MKLTKESLANGLAFSTAVAWGICSVLVALMPGFSLRVVGWWMHGMDVTSWGGWSLSWANFVWGGVAMTTFAWLFGYLLGWSLKYFGER